MAERYRRLRDDRPVLPATLVGHTLVIRADLLIWPLRQVFALVEQTSRELVLETVPEWFSALSPEQVREPTEALMEHA